MPRAVMLYAARSQFREGKPRAMKIEDIEGIGKKYGKKLREMGVGSVGKLLEEGGTRKARAAMAKDLDISPKLILEWVNHADLYRVKGIGSEYSDLLEEAGVDSVKELAQRKPENLAEKIREVNEKKKLVRRVCGVKMVTKWVDQAKGLPKMVHH